MTTIQDPLAKPVWPVVSPELGEAVVSRLINLMSPLKMRGGVEKEVFKGLTVGFNSSMAALEKTEKENAGLKAIFVCRSDIPPQIAAPLGLASAANRLPIVALPKGAKARLELASGHSDAAVIGLRHNPDHLASDILALIENIGPAKADWTYRPTQLFPRKKAPKSRKSQPKPKKVSSSTSSTLH